MSLHFAVFFLACCANLFSEGNAYSKCDDTIVEKIKQQWGTDIPKDLINKAKANGKELVILITPKYYAAGTECVYSFFSDNQFALTRVPTQGSPVTTNISIKEDGGKTVSESKGATVLRYHVFQKGGVTGVYTCNTLGADSDKDADGMIKVKAGAVDQAVVEEAKTALQNVGVTVSEPLCQNELKASAAEGGK